MKLKKKRFTFYVEIKELVSLNTILGGGRKKKSKKTGKIIGKNGGHWGRKENKDAISKSIIESGVLDGVEFNGKVHLEFTPYLTSSQRSFDIVNYSITNKAIEDTMVDLGVLKKDDQGYVLSHKMNTSIEDKKLSICKVKVVVIEEIYE